MKKTLKVAVVAIATIAIAAVSYAAVYSMTVTCNSRISGMKITVGTTTFNASCPAGTQTQIIVQTPLYMPE